MPVVLVESEVTESGHSYADVTGTSYEFPRRYKSAVLPGQSFVYYRGRRRKGGKSRPPAYFGTGTIGHVKPSQDGDRLICQIVDYKPFTNPVLLRDDNGEYLEPGASRRGYFQPGVRRVSDEVFRKIVIRGLPA